MTTLKSPATANRPLHERRGIVPLSMMLLASSGLLLLAGCGGMVNDAVTAPQQGVTIQGLVHGGQQPISGATIQLYEAPATGTTYAPASVKLIGSTVTTDTNGNFTITGDYTCPVAPDDQVYITASQGNSGGGNNANIELMAALGSCGNLSSSTYIIINEVTTVAAAYALSQFATDYQHIGADSTNYTGLKQAFATAGNLVNTTTGTANSSTPAYATLPTGATSATFKSIVPQAEIYFLANILSVCVNTNGVGGTSTGCSNLFTDAMPAGGTMPTDTFQAILDIAKNPANNVHALYTLEGSAPAPFSTTLSQPNDWTLSLSFTGGGLGGTNGTTESASPDLAIDGSGNIWVVNSNLQTVTELNNLGAPISPTTVLTPSFVAGGYPASSLVSPVALAIDVTGNVWIADGGTNVLTELTSAGNPVGSGYSFGTSDFGSGIAIDGLNNVWLVASKSIDPFTAGVEGTPFTQDIQGPNGAIAIDGSNNIWVENDDTSSVTEFTYTETLLGNSGDSLAAPSSFGAIDNTGKFWAPESEPGSGEQVYGVFNGNDAQNVAYYNQNTVYSLGNAVSVSTDGAGHMWTVSAGTNYGAVTEMTETGSAISPAATGFINTNANPLVSPGGSGIDASGNLWIINNGGKNSNVLEFVGVAAPTITPLAAQITGSNKIGQKP